MALPIGKIGIVGVGLLGGSIAKACKANNLAERVTGFGENINNLEKAKKNNIIDNFFHLNELSKTEVLLEFDLLVLATPVEIIKEILGKIIFVDKNQAPNLTITDVGSTKNDICEFAWSLPFKDQFVGSHPMAGKEKSGFDYSDANLYKNATIFVCGAPKNEGFEKSRASAHKEKVVEFWSFLGGNVVSLSPGEHDFIVALTSHVPHLLSAAYVSQLDNIPLVGAEIFYKGQKWFGKGLLDFTRIAQGSAGMWTDIIKQNPKFINQAIEDYIQNLNNIQKLIASENWEKIYSFFDKSRALREKLKDE